MASSNLGTQIHPCYIVNSLYACIYPHLYVMVIAQGPGIYGCKQAEFEGEARGQGLFTSP